MEDAVKLTEEWITAGKPGYVCVTGVHGVCGEALSHKQSRIPMAHCVAVGKFSAAREPVRNDLPEVQFTLSTPVAKRRTVVVVDVS